jgi:hypothetical protein
MHLCGAIRCIRGSSDNGLSSTMVVVFGHGGAQ